jgi:hypothetical protein
MARSPCSRCGVSYTQCKDEKEVDAEMDKRKAGFVSDDHRIYEEIGLFDNALVYTFDAKTAMALYDLQSNIEMVMSSGHECGFLELVNSAQLLEKTFKDALAAIKFKPIVRTKK